MKRSITSRIIRIFIAIILGILSFGLLAYMVLLLPPVQRYVIDFTQKELSSLLDADISIGSVRADLLSSIELRDIKVKDKNRTDDSISVGRIKVRYNLAALLTKTVSIPGVTIEDVYATVSVSPDNTLHIPAVPPSIFTDTTESSSDPDSLPVKIQIRRARILNINGVYKDSALNMVGRVSGAQVRGRFHKLDSIRLQLSVPDGSFNSPWWNGNLDSISVSGILQFDGLDLHNAYMRASGCEVKAKGNIAFNEDGIWSLSADVQSDMAPVTAISEYVPGLKQKGAVTGVVSWKGTMAEPVLSCVISGKGFQYESVAIDSIHLSANYGDDKTAQYK
ncbi:MAG: hypothetical protein GX640_09330, partial [Fibrobacter sp.]|nr:hypothetical protein [Fibrobacter sp.]